MATATRAPETSDSAGLDPELLVDPDYVALVEFVRKQAKEMIESYLTRHRPGGRSGRPSYTHHEVDNFAHALVRHQREGVRHALRDLKDRENGLRLSEETLLPDPLPVWLDHGRQNLELLAPLAPAELREVKARFREHLRDMVAADGGLPLPGHMVITVENGEYKARYTSDLLKKSESASRTLREARAKVWKRALACNASEPLIPMLSALGSIIKDATRQIGAVPWLVSADAQQAATGITLDERAVVQVREELIYIRDCEASDRAEATWLGLMALASSARPDGKMGQVRLFRWLTVLALVRLGEQAHEDDTPQSTGIVRFCSERLSVLMGHEEKRALRAAVPKGTDGDSAPQTREKELRLETADTIKCKSLCDIAASFVNAHPNPWLAKAQRSKG